MTESDTQSTLSKSSSSGVANKHGPEARVLYPLLACFESTWPSTLVVLGLLMDLLHLFALIINPTFDWGGMISGIGVPIYFSILPIWDASYQAIALEFSLYSILFWIGTVVLLAVLGASFVLAYMIHEQLDRHGQDVGKFLLHIVTGAALSPLIHMYLSFSVCDVDRDTLTAYPGETCLRSPYGTFLFAIAVLCMLLLGLYKLVVTVFLYEDHPASLHPKARPHNVVEVSFVALQLLMAVLYHYMPFMGQRQAFAGILAAGALIVAALHAFYLPFFSQWVNSLRVMGLTVLSYVALLQCILLENTTQDAAKSTNNWSSLILYGGAPVAAVVGYVLANFRISRQCLKDIECAARGEPSAHTQKALFPSGLPEEETSKYREHESIVLGEARFARTQESLTGPQQDREDARDGLWVCTPYLDAIYNSTDVEVATRQVFLVQQRTGLPPPALMVAFGVRIYAKGLSRFAGDRWLELQFATFLCSVAPQRSALALTICDRIARQDVSLALAYRVSRRASSVSSAMLLRDNAHKKSFLQAQTMHKEALVNMKQFWGKLLADQVDIVQLGMLAKIITDRREEGLRFFERVIAESNDTFSLIRYAQFLEQVMMDTEAANNTRESVLDSLEQEQLGVTKDSSRQPVIASRQRTTTISRSRTISSLNFNINVIFSILFGVIAGLLIFGAVTYQERLDLADKVQTAGHARGLSQELLLYVNRLVGAVNDTDVSDLSWGLQSRLTEFRSYHNQLTAGKYKTTFQDVRDAMTLPMGEAVTVGGDSVIGKGLWELGDLLISSVETVLSSSTSADGRSETVQSVRLNALAGVARMYNTSLTAYTAEATNALQIGQYVMIGFYLLSLCILAIVYFVLILNFRKISSSKLSTLSLFTLIPKNALEKLIKEGSDRIDHFDMPDEVFEQMKVQRGLEDDTDAMKQVLQDMMDIDGEVADTSGSKHAGAARVSPSAHLNGMQHAGADLDGQDDLDLHGKFALLLKNSAVGDTGKMKQLHHGQFEPPYPKDMWNAPIESAEEVRERQRLQNDAHVEDDLQKLRSAGAVDVSGDDSNSSEGSDTRSATEGRDSKQGTLQRITSSFVFVIFVLAVVIGALTIIDLRVSERMGKTTETAHEHLAQMYNAAQQIQEIRRGFEQVVLLQTAASYKEFLRVWYSSRYPRYHNGMLRDQTLLEVMPGVFQADFYYRVWMQQQQLAVILTCEAASLTCTEVQEHFEWHNDLLTSDDIGPGEQITPAITNEAVALMTPAQKTLAARIILNSAYFNQLERKVTENLAAAQRAQAERTSDNLEQDALLLYDRAIVEVTLASIVIVVALVGLWELWSSNRPVSVGVLLLSLLLAAALVGVVAPRLVHNNVRFPTSGENAMTTVAGKAKYLFDHEVALRRAVNDTQCYSLLSERYAGQVIILGSPRAALAIEQNGGDYKLEQAWSVLSAVVDPKYFEALSNAFSAVRQASYVALVAATLGASANGMHQSPALTSVQWNFQSEVYGDRIQQTFPSQTFYTSRATDLALPAADQFNLATALLYGPYRQTIFREGISQLNTVVAADVEHLRRALAEEAALQSTLVTAALVLSFAIAGAGLVLILVSLFEVVESVSVTRLSESSQREDELFRRLTKQSQIALLLLAVLFTILFIFTIVDLDGSVRYSHNQNAASLREFDLIRAMVHTQHAVNTSWTGWEAREDLESSLLHGHHFYFGEHGGRPGAVKETSSHAALFGPTSPDTSRFSCSIAALKTSTLKLLTNSSVTAVTPLGVDVVVRRIADLVMSISYVADSTARQLRLDVLLSAPFGISLELVRSSTADYTATVKTLSTGGFIGFLVILAATLIALALLFFLIFRPMIGQLLNEEEGTKVMLKMIPAEVRESVPAIAEYLETGVVLQDLKMHEINEAASDLSTIPTVTIDAVGTIVKFSRAAEDAFLWTKAESVGQNVKMLMPENIAVEHDTYLSNYRKTGVKKIIGSLRKIRARRKDGTLFPAEILVREVRSGRNTHFVGTLRNVSVEIEFERAIVLSKAVSEAATVPIVVINMKGVILRFNSAAEETFKCGQEVVGKKVNVLMPQAEADVHDQNLDRYLKTGVKTVIDKQRHVRAKKLSGELFPARLSIRELKRGKESIFIGYVEDMTKHVHLQMTSMVSDAIMATSPVPLVAIDDIGNIISWSPAASHCFGLTPQDALGKNVKMIMPDHVAQRHDGYLQSYQKTGRKKMIGNITLTKAKRKEEDGSITMFPVRIAVKDIVQQSKNSYYVAFIQDVSQAQQLETEYKISSSITNLSSLPLITIDEKGLIQAFSAAAEVCFGWTKPEVMGQNVIMLMPENYRADHDGYLERYLKTGIKTVIDINRRAQGVRKDGRVFPIELMVREVKHEGKYNFIGYVRDISEDFRMAEANAYNDAISQLATVPVICISIDGTILSCSESTCDRFLWSRDELLGQNVQVLMPDSVAVKHDGYLKRYKERLATDGVEKARASSTLLHKERRVVARTRDEQHFHVAVHVRDLHIDGMPPMFVGYLRDITDEINQATQRTIAEAIESLSSIPLICISSSGKITLFSQAAEKDFGYSAAEVLGCNVKMLMPEDVAKKHDGYLKAYAKTGVKTVLDSKRQVVAQKKSGVQFAAEIMVKEVFQKDATGRDIVEYIGFVRDLTQQFILLQANTINEVVSQLATVPIVIMNPRGIVLDFNAAACREFGHTMEEVVGKNIKMLMPDEIAIHHDGYLQKYRTTRKKTVVDSTRRNTAKRKDGSTFLAEISVREVVKQGTEGQFIGYVRDVSHEQLLSKQHKINSTIIDLSVTPLIVIDIHGIVSIFSRAAEEAFGYTRAEVDGKNLKMLMPPEVARVHDSYLEAYARTGVKNVIDTFRRVRAMRANGRTFPAEISVKEIVNDDGEKIFIGYLQDCTQEAIMSAAAAFSECVNQLSPVPVVAINHLGIIMRFSAAAEHEFGVSAADIIGQNVTALQTEENARVHNEYLERYLRTGVKTVLDAKRVLPCKRLDGTVFMAEITAREVIDRTDPQALPNFVGYIRNIETELRTKESFKEGNAMLELSPIPVISISLRGMILEVNPAAELCFGYTKEEVLGKNVKMLMPANIANQHDGYLQRYLDTRVKTVIDTIRHVVGRRKNGENFQVEIGVREIMVTGMENQYIGYVRDITADMVMAESSALNEAVNAMSTTPFVVIEPLGTILKFSHAAEMLFRYTQDEILGQNVKNLMPNGIAIKHDRYLEVYQATKKKTVVDSKPTAVQAKRKDGSIFHCEITVREVLAEDGVTTSVFVGYIRCLDEVVLRVGQSAEINGMMMDLSTQGVCIIDHVGTIERVNDAALHMFNIPSNVSLIGQNIKTLMPDAVAEKHDGYLSAYYNTRVKHVVDSKRNTQGREWGTKNLFPIEIAVKEIIEAGKEIRYLGYIRPIAKEIEIDTVKKTSQAALDLSRFSTVVIDAKGTILMFSRAAEQMWEVLAKDVIGKNVKLLMPPEIAAHHDDYLATYRRTGEKRVVDSLRTVSAKSVKTGRMFTVQLQIKECQFSVSGLESVFVGYITAKDS